MTRCFTIAMNKGFPAAQIDLDRLHSGPLEWSGELPSDAEAWGGGTPVFLGRPRLRFRAEHGGHDGVRVQGALTARVRLACRRCLRELEHRVQVNLDLRFDPAVEPWEEEEGIYGLDVDASILDLSDALREELRLAVPEYPECAGGCSGMCPRCGADLGETDCGCARCEPDPRWDVLRTLVPNGRPGAVGRDDDSDGREG